MSVRARGGISLGLWGSTALQHIAETSPAVIFGFFIYYAVSYYIKTCLLYFSFCFFSCLFSCILTPASGFSFSGRIIRNPLGEALISPFIFPNSQKNIRPNGFSGKLRFCSFLWIWSDSTIDICSLADWFPLQPPWRVFTNSGVLTKLIKSTSRPLNWPVVLM